MGYISAIAPAGRLFYASHVAGDINPGTGNTINDGDVICMPLVVPIDVTIAKVLFEITATGTGNWYPLIYNDVVGEDHYPGIKLWSGSAVSIASTGILGPTGLSISLEADTLYWIGVYTDTTANPTYRRWLASSAPTGWMSTFPGTGRTTAQIPSNTYEPIWKLTGQSSIPDPFTIGSATDDTIFRMPIIALEQG
jgi:hypothetical protein